MAYMKRFLIILLFWAPATGTAQYYYHDIITALETERRHTIYRSEQVRRMTATGIDANGSRTTDYAEVHDLFDSGRTLRISLRNGPAHSVVRYGFNDAGRLISCLDSSNGVVSQIEYEHDTAGRILRIRNTLRDSARDFNQTETHQWSYDSSGRPSGMWRVINGSDSLEIRFSTDENGNTGEERSYRKSRETAMVYYYYDDTDRLTDVVRYNTRYKRLMPDLMFEYDESGRVIQKIATTSGQNQRYVIWRFIYDEKGLKTREVLFDQEKRLTGKIEYQYQRGPSR